MKLTDKAASPTHRVLVYGAPKTGKTQLVASLAAHYNLIWFDLENGYGTLLKLPKDQQAKVELISIPDSKVFPIAIETMLKVINGTEVRICEEHGKVSCPICTKDNKPTTQVCLKELDSNTVVVIDSLSQLSNSAIAFITKGQPDDYKMDFSDWGNLRAIVEKFLSQVQQARYNIVCISHEEEVEMEDGRKKIVPVCGSSKSSRNTAKYFDHVLYCELKNKKHITASSTTYANNILTGSRTDVVMESLADPTLMSIFAQGSASVSATQGQVALNQLKVLGGIKK
jgi:hypothetical protein